MNKINGATLLAVAYAVLASAPSDFAQAPNQVSARPNDVTGWGKTRWGMSEGQLKRAVAGHWRPATKEERAGDRGLYMPFVLQGVSIGGRKFIGLFGLPQTDRRLVRVTLHSGVSFIGAAEGFASSRTLPANCYASWAHQTRSSGTIQDTPGSMSITQSGISPVA